MITLRAALRSIGRAAMAGLATENGWCWIWGFGPAPRYLYLDAQRGEFRAPDTAETSREARPSR